MLAFDIETVATEATIAMEYPIDERTPPTNYKSDEAIARWRKGDIAKWRAELLKDAALSPRTGRVVAIGYAAVGGMDAECDTARTEDAEGAVLTAFWARVREHRGRIAGFNSFDFDLPFLLIRSALHDIVPTGIDVLRLQRRFSYDPHFDVRMALGFWDRYAKGTLDDWARAFGLDPKLAHGSEVAAMVAEGRWGDLSKYAMADAATVGHLTERVAPMFGVAIPKGATV